MSVLAPTTDTRLTLTTCHPKYSARQRLVVSAVLEQPPVDEQAAEPAPRPQPPPRSASPPGRTERPTTFAGAGFGTGGSVPAALGWGAATILAGSGWWCAIRRRNRLSTYAAGALSFLGVLLGFYVQLERVLPADF